jgi:hypothetical protein
MHESAQRQRKMTSLSRCLLMTLVFYRCIQIFHHCCHVNSRNLQTVNARHVSIYQWPYANDTNIPLVLISTSTLELPFE